MISVMALIQTATELQASVVQDNERAMRMGAGGLSGVQARVFNRVIDSSQRGIDYARGDFEFDALTQFEFPDISSSMTAAASGGFNLTMGLPGPLVSEVQSIVCLKNTVIEPPKGPGALKRMSILRKRPDVSSQAFQAEWFGLHALLAPRLPGVVGYRQNLVIDGPRNADGHMLVDGMVELWFPDEPSIDAAFASGAGKTLMMHAQEFIAEISTFLVEPIHMQGA